MVALLIMVVFEYLMVSYTPGLNEAAIKYQDSYKHEFRFLWYVGFMLCDLAILTLTLLTHHRFDLKLCFCAKVVLVAYSSAMFLQAAQYLETEFFGTTFFLPIYSYGIPAINMTFAAVVFGFMITVLGSLILAKYTRFKGVTWRI